MKRQKRKSAKAPSSTLCQLKLFDPLDDSDVPEAFGPVYRLDRPDDVWVMRLAIRRFNRLAEREDLPFCIGVFEVK